MIDWKDGFRSRYYNVTDIFKRTIVSLSVIVTFTIGTVSANSIEITKVFHVYVNGERVGTVDNKQVVQKYIENREHELKVENPTIDFGLDDNVVYIQEKVFRANVNNQQVLQQLSDKLEILAEASSILIDEKSIVYLENMEQANEVLRLLKLKYIPENVLNELEARDPNSTLPVLEEGQSRILDVSFKEKVTISETKISPDKVLTVEEAVTFLSKGTLEEKVYKVQEGDVLGVIAVNHDLKLAELIALNPNITEETLIKPGDEMNVTALKPFLNVLIQEEVYKRESIAYTKEITENKNIPKGDNKVTQKGQNGEKLVNYLVSKENNFVVEKKTISEETVKEPIVEIVEKGTKVIPSRGTGSLAWPAIGGYVSSTLGYRWGKMHKGIDIARPSNRTIIAADNGTVVATGYEGTYGKRVIINHNNGITTLYAHLSSISVKVGQTVQRGQSIGVMGDTGNSTGIHLHFEVEKNGKIQNPLNYISR